MVTMHIQTPHIVICEPEREMRMVYAQHFERHHVPVHAVGEYSELLRETSRHAPYVLLVRLPESPAHTHRLLQELSIAGPRSLVVTISHDESLDTQHLLGTTVAAHIHAPKSSPKQVIQTVINLLKPA
jgi:DNA-binding NtrC family response regulator